MEYTSKETQELKDQFTPVQLLCCTASRQFEDGMLVFGGVGNSFLSVAIAKLVHSPNLILSTEAGYAGFASVSSMVSPADNVGGYRAMVHQGLFETFRDQQAGLVDKACLGLAQIDKFGNVNVTYVDPMIRMNGSGGGSDISSSAKSIVYIAEYLPRIFKKKVDYITNPGFLDGSEDARERANLLGNGPQCMVTNRGVFRFEKETREIYLAEVFPWQDKTDIEAIKKDVPWDLKIADELKIIAPPIREEIDAIALMDPFYTYRTPSFIDTPVGKTFLSGKRDINAYNTICELFDEGIRTAKTRVF